MRSTSFPAFAIYLTSYGVTMAFNVPACISFYGNVDHVGKEDLACSKSSFFRGRGGVSCSVDTRPGVWCSSNHYLFQLGDTFNGLWFSGRCLPELCGNRAVLRGRSASLALDIVCSTWVSTKQTNRRASEQTSRLDSKQASKLS